MLPPEWSSIRQNALSLDTDLSATKQIRGLASNQMNIDTYLDPRPERPRQDVILFLTLTSRRSVFRRPCKHFTAIGKSHIAAGPVRRTVLGTETFHSYLIPDLQNVFRNASPLKHAWRAARETPSGNFAAIVLHINVKPDVRVRPLNLGDRASDFHGLGAVILRRECMVCEHRRRRCQQKTCRQTNELLFH